MLMPLKRKYRQPGRMNHRQWDPKEGTLTFSSGNHASKKGGNSGGGTVRPNQTLRPRMRAYWGTVVRSCAGTNVSRTAEDHRGIDLMLMELGVLGL